jgi:hypothetical protein
MKVIIVGGGIGGLSTALMLHAAAWIAALRTVETPFASWASASTCACHQAGGTGAARSARHRGIEPTNCSTPTASGRRYGASCSIDAGYSAAILLRGRLQASSIKQCAPGSADRAFTVIAWARFVRDEAGVTLFIRPPRRASGDRARLTCWSAPDGIHSLVRGLHALPANEGQRDGDWRHPLARRRRMADVPHRPVDGDRRRRHKLVVYPIAEAA